MKPLFFCLATILTAGVSSVAAAIVTTQIFLAELEDTEGRYRQSDLEELISELDDLLDELHSSTPGLADEPTVSDDAPKQSEEKTDVLPELGTYYAEGSMGGNSYMQVVEEEDRYCIRSVSMPPSPYGGDRIEIIQNADFSKAGIESFYPVGRMTYRHNPELVEINEALEACLSSVGVYRRQLPNEIVPSRLREEEGR